MFSVTYRVEFFKEDDEDGITAFYAKAGTEKESVNPTKMLTTGKIMLVAAKRKIAP